MLSKDCKKNRENLEQKNIHNVEFFLRNIRSFQRKKSYWQLLVNAVFWTEKKCGKLANFFNTDQRKQAQKYVFWMLSNLGNYLFYLSFKFIYHVIKLTSPEKNISCQTAFSIELHMTFIHSILSWKLIKSKLFLALAEESWQIKSTQWKMKSSHRTEKETFEKFNLSIFQIL